MAASAPEVTVAVVSWNTRELLGACLRSLRDDAASGRADVWVVDNGSTDGSPELVGTEFPWARLHAPGANIGFGAAVNAVAARTSSAWLAPANADVALRPGALRGLLRAGVQDPGAGVLAPRLVLPDGSTQHSVYAFPTAAFTAAFNLGLTGRPAALADRLCLEGRWDPDRPRRVPWAIGAFLLMRRTAWDRIGGFDPALWMYAEDLDLGWRLRRAGFATRYVPDAVVDHEGSAATGAAWGEQRALRWQTATYAWHVRRRGRGYAALVGAINVAGASARYALRRLAGSDRRAAMARRWARNHAQALRAALRDAP